ncbi:Hsp70 family protein [Leeia aquatica]|uniref:Hsp70 family protein n=1 Tax=Leeia aquatica TaxID=2725557 RepID=A0A847SGC1_9NEIS|nr:Hsp70 family protein [Leeia aquatica]NLR76298.1 Hsp70 family protein [Leeia aquatica]
MTSVCGLDFGTSNSTAGWVVDAQPRLLALEDDKFTLPSAVFFNAENQQVSFGRAALAEYLSGEEGRLMRSLKSLLGSSLLDGHTEVLGRKIPFRDLLRFFIQELKRRAEQAAGRSFERAVLGRPVFFVDEDPQADQLAEDTLRQTALDCGFREVSFQYEPIAAAFDYEQQVTREELVLIVDIGGGTSDFSLIRVSPQRRHLDERRDDILANAGVHIGGTDFDRRLSLAAVMPLLGYRSKLRHRDAEVPSSYYFNLATWHTINQAYTRKVWAELQDVKRDVAEPERFARLLQLVEQRAGHALAIAVEQAKIELSSQPETVLELDQLAPPLQHVLSGQQLADAIDADLKRITQTVTTLLQQAGVRAEQVDTVFFTGGASGVSSLRQQVQRLLPASRPVEGDLFGSIGAGLALAAHRRYG